MSATRLLTSTLLTAGVMAMGCVAFAQTSTPYTSGQTTTMPPAVDATQPAINSGIETTAQRMERERLERERMGATERVNNMKTRSSSSAAGTVPMRDGNGNLLARSDRN